MKKNLGVFSVVLMFCLWTSFTRLDAAEIFNSSDVQTSLSDPKSIDSVQSDTQNALQTVVQIVVQTVVQIDVPPNDSATADLSQNNLSQTNSNQQNSVQTDSDGESQMSKALKPFVDSGAMPGMVSILSDAQGNLTVDCIGWADIENKIPMQPDTFFWIASMSKQITAAALMTLVDDGKVSLDDPIEKYLPEMKNIKVAENREDGTVILRAPKSKPTVRQVLCHTSGWTFLTPTMQRFGIDVMPMRILASNVADFPLSADPGTKYQYSNIGIDLAAAIIEAVSGKPYHVYLQEKILDPLEMKETTFWPNEDQIRRLAKNYDIQKSPIVPTTVPFLSKASFDDRTQRFAEGGGGLFSTPIELIHFFQMIAGKGVYQGKRILSEKAVQTFASKQTEPNIAENYSLGMRIAGDWFGHDGALQTDGLANAKTGQARLWMVQISGTWNPPAKQTWFQTADKIQTNK